MTIFNESPNSLKIWEHYNAKFGQLIAPIGLLKACSIISSKFPNYPRLCVFCVAPSRQFKSQTSSELMKIFSPKFWINTGSDFTIHGLRKKYNNKINLKCIMINDGTLLLSSKAERTKDRIIAGVSELITEGYYHYDDFKESFVLKGKISMIMNMTLETYTKQKNKLLGSTFLERFATVFYSLPETEQLHYIKERKTKILIKWNKKIQKITEGELENLDEYNNVLIEHAKDISALSFKPLIGVYDIVLAATKAHAFLNMRNKLCEDDIQFIRLLKPYFIDPSAPNEHKIIKLRKEGRSQNDICLLLNRSPEKYRPYVSRVIKKAKERGLL